MGLEVLGNSQMLYENLTLIATTFSKIDRDETCKNYLNEKFKEYDYLGYY